jgi:hypothetical protein
MKNLLLLLVLANVLYFLWGMYQEAPPTPGSAIVNETDFGPPIEIAATPDAETVASVGAFLGAGQSSNLEAVVGRSCVTIGPLRQQTDADAALLEYAGEGMKANTRSMEAEVFVGHWVQIRDVESDAVANGMLDTLSKGGLPEAYLVRTDDEGLKISLGVFDDMEGAEKVELRARSLGFVADVSARMAERTVYFVDLRLPPRRGAGAIVEKYGEDRVALRGEATCPP